MFFWIAKLGSQSLKCLLANQVSKDLEKGRSFWSGTGQTSRGSSGNWSDGMIVLDGRFAEPLLDISGVKG